MWIKMLDNRNLLSHTYDFPVFDQAVAAIATPCKFDVKPSPLIKLPPLCEHIERVRVMVYPLEEA